MLSSGCFDIYQYTHEKAAYEIEAARRKEKMSSFIFMLYFWGEEEIGEAVRLVHCEK